MAREARRRRLPAAVQQSKARRKRMPLSRVECARSGARLRANRRPKSHAGPARAPQAGAGPEAVAQRLVHEWWRLLALPCSHAPLYFGAARGGCGCGGPASAAMRGLVAARCVALSTRAGGDAATYVECPGNVEASARPRRVHAFVWCCGGVARASRPRGRLPDRPAGAPSSPPSNNCQQC